MRKKISAILFYFFFLISCLLIPLIYLYVTLNINAAKNTSLSVSSVSAAQKQDTTTPSDTSGAPSDNTDLSDTVHHNFFVFQLIDTETRITIKGGIAQRTIFF